MLKWKKSFDVQMVMKAELEELLKTRTDLVFLQNANVKLQFEVIRSGKMLFSDDEEYRTDFEESVLRRYWILCLLLTGCAGK